jgi:hypothetical protein
MVNPVEKIALIGIFCVAGLGGAGMMTSSAPVAGLCATLATLVVLSIVAGILWYSDKHLH